MKYMATTLAMALAALITLTSVPRVAHAELVFEDELKNDTAAEAVAEPAAPAKVENKIEERKDLSKSEMMRRQRMREEVKNEDLLTQKLEELRLKDEMRRTNQILGSGIEKKDEAAPAPLQEERVGAAKAEAVAPAPAIAPVNPAVNTPVMAQAAAPTQASVATIAMPTEEKSNVNRVTIAPRGGLSNLVNSMYEISSKYAVGGDIMVDVTDHIAFLGGYTYSAYQMGPGASLYYPQNYTTRQIQMNDHNVNAGVRGYLLGTDSRVRPFVGAGVGYRKGYINFDEKLRQYYNSYDPFNTGMGLQDVEITGFTGALEGGLDFKLTNNIALTGSFRYFTVLSARQNTPLSPYAFGNGAYNGGMYGGYYGAMPAYPYSTAGYYGYSNDARAQAADAVAKNSFYQLMVGLSVSF